MENNDSVPGLELFGLKIDKITTVRSEKAIKYVKPTISNPIFLF